MQPTTPGLESVRRSTTVAQCKCCNADTCDFDTSSFIHVRFDLLPVVLVCFYVNMFEVWA